jgi:hypothetical protein
MDFTRFSPGGRWAALIAIMGDSYEKVKESERVEAIRERARIVVEMEKRFPKSHRYLVSCILWRCQTWQRGLKRLCGRGRQGG